MRPRHSPWWWAETSCHVVIVDRDRSHAAWLDGLAWALRDLWREWVGTQPYDEPSPTLTQALAALGMTHRAPPAGRQGREIVDAEGSSLGVHTAREGWALVDARRAAR